MVLLVVNILVFLLTYYSRTLTYYLSLVPLYVSYRHFFWQIFTYMFVHGSFWHLLSNMIGLLIFGRIVERAVGTKEFLLYYFLCGTLSGLASYLSSVFTGNYMMIVLGASGTLYAVMFLFSVLFPNAVVFIFGLIPIRAPLMVVLYFCLDFFGQFSSDGIAHSVHLFGLLFGVLYVTIRMRMNPLKPWGLV